MPGPFKSDGHGDFNKFLEVVIWALYSRIWLRNSTRLLLKQTDGSVISPESASPSPSLHDQQKGTDHSVLLSVANKFCEFYTTVIRGTPMMVQLLIMGFVIFKSSRNLVGVAILSLGINSGAYTAEIIRSGIMSIDPGQMEAGRSLGMDYITVMKDIIIPQAIKNILPALGNELITLFKDTSLVTVIGLTDLTKAAQQIQAKTYQAFMPYIGIAIMYLVVVMILTKLLGILERRLRESDRR